MKLWLPRALLLQLSQQTNAKLKINLLMGSRLSKQLLCAKAALHLAVTTQPVPLLVLLRPCVAQAHEGSLAVLARWVDVPARTWSWGAPCGLGFQRAELSGCGSLPPFDPYTAFARGRAPPGSELMVQSWFGGPGTASVVTWL